MSIVFPLITYPYVARVLNADGLGKINFASTTIGYYSLIAVLGISSYAGREGIQYRDDQKKLNQFSSEVYTLNLITTLGSLLVLAISCVVVAKFRSYLSLISIYSLTIVFSVFGVEWIYRIEEDYTYVTIRAILIQCISVVCLFIFVRRPDDYVRYACLTVLASVGSNIFNLIHSRKYIQLRICKNLKRVFSHFSACLVFFSSSIASSIYSNIDIMMLGFYSTDYVVGIYSVAVKIYSLIKTLLTAITSVMVPRLTYYKTHDQIDEYNALLSRLMKSLWTLLLPIVTGVILVSKEIIIVFLGAGYEEAQSCLIILSFAIFFSLFAGVSNGCILIVNKREKMALLTTVSAAIVNFGTNLIAIPAWGADGAAATTVIAEAVVLTISWFTARKYAVLGRMSKTIMTSVIGCVVMISISALIQMSCETSLLSLILKLVLCSCIYFSLQYIMRNEIVRIYAKMMVDRIKRICP